MSALAKRCSTSSEACVRRCRKATSPAKRMRSTPRSRRSRKDTDRRSRLRLPLRQRRPRPPSESRTQRLQRPLHRPLPQNSPLSSAPLRLRRRGLPYLQRDRLHKRGPGQSGGANAPVPRAAAQRPAPPPQERSQPPGNSPQAPTPVAGRPAAGASTAASPARSQLAAAMANQPPSGSRTGQAAPPVGAKGGKDEGLPGVAALDPGRAIRPNRADGHEESGAPPVVAARRDEPVQWAEAPEIAAEFDRPGMALRPEAEIQRPGAPAPKSPSPSACCGSRRPLFSELSLRWRELQSLCGKSRKTSPSSLPSRRSNPLRRSLRRRLLASRRIRPRRRRLQRPRPRRKRANRALRERRQQPRRRNPRAGSASCATAPAPSAGRAAMLIASADNPQKPAVSLGSTVWS